MYATWYRKAVKILQDNVFIFKAYAPYFKKTYSWIFSAQISHLLTYGTLNSIVNVIAITVNMNMSVHSEWLGNDKKTQKNSLKPKNQYIVPINLLITWSSLRS